MPELPEVETTCRGIAPHVTGCKIQSVIVREYRLRWPIPRQLSKKLTGKVISDVNRRGKYILLTLDGGKQSETIIIHLGMSGSLRICNQSMAAEKHDHVDIVFENGKLLRFRDPRKFGCLLMVQGSAHQHKLLSKLGIEPLSTEFDGHYLYEYANRRRCSIKALIMNSHIVTGVGNIYACESLYLAGINPGRKSSAISLARCQKLANSIKQVLSSAIEKGGTTLKDFTRENGEPGYFAQQLQVYGRKGEACYRCGKPVQHLKQQQRASYYCKSCQA